MVSRIVLTLAFGLALSGCAGGGSYVRSDAALGRVVVYQNGIAYFERNADLSDDELVLRVPADKVDDFLKSLTVVDQATGQPVATARPSILPTTDSGIVEMRIALAGPKPHRVRLAYVTDAPAWKPTYRLLLGKGGKVGLQGWAIVDNVSGEDWENVTLGVASSSALSFKFDLRSLKVVQREQLGSGDAFAVAPPEGGAAYSDTGESAGAVVSELTDDALAAGDDNAANDTAKKKLGLSYHGPDLPPLGSQGLEALRRSVSTELDSARKDRDVVRTTCLNDKLGQLDAVVRSAREREQAARQAATKHDVELERHEQTVLTVLAERGQALRAEANQCIGEELALAGASTAVHMEIDADESRRAPAAAEDPAKAREHEYHTRLADLEGRISELKDRITRSHSRFRIEGLALDGEPDPAAAGLARAERARQQLLARGIGAERIETAAAGVRRGEGATVRIVELPPKDRLALLRDTVLAGGSPAPLQAPVGAAHFESPAPVTVPRGSSTLLSMVSAQTPGEVVYLYDPESTRGNADFAFQAVRFVNPTDSVLDSGPVTVLADGRFIGEGLCEPIPARSVAFVPFALDRQVRVERKAEDGEHMARIISAARGVLTAEVQRTRQSTLVLRNSLPEPATVYVRHTVAPGYTLTKGQVERERVGSAYLFRVQVPAAGQTELVIEESTPVERTLDVRSPADRASVSVYVSEVPANGPLRAELATILQKAAAIADIEERLGSARDQAREYRQRMDEVHGQIVTLRAVKSANALVTTLENTLRDVTEAVSKSTSAVVGLQQDLLVARVSFQQAVSGLSLQTQPKP